jgi:hypothetical protein
MAKSEQREAGWIPAAMVDIQQKEENEWMVWQVFEMIKLAWYVVARKR